MAVKRFAVSLPENIAKSFEENIDEMDYDNRSKAVTEAIKRFLEEKKEAGIEVGAMIIKAEKRSGRVKAKLDGIKSRYEDAILTSSRDSGKNRFVDVWVVRGKKCHLTRLKRRVRTVDGIVSCWMQTLSNDLNGGGSELKMREILDEDIGDGDITSNAIVPEKKKSKAVIKAKGKGILCGLRFSKEIFKTYDGKIMFVSLKKDGDILEEGDVVAQISGPARSILACERSALNCIMAISGNATHVRAFVEKIGKHGAKLLDTRKTIPAYRRVQKYAVKIAGGENHRAGLFDQILIKENHIKIAGSVTEAIRRAKASGQPVMVEVTDLDELKEALDMKVKRILLDNMSIRGMKKAVRITNGRAELEATGNITLDNIKEVAATGVDYISVGSALTLNFSSVDFSLEIVG